VGLVANARFLQMLDFMGGFFLLDLSGDDGTATSVWPWQAPGTSNECMRPEIPY